MRGVRTENYQKKIIIFGADGGSRTYEHAKETLGNYKRFPPVRIRSDTTENRTRFVVVRGERCSRYIIMVPGRGRRAGPLRVVGGRRGNLKKKGGGGTAPGLRRRVLDGPRIACPGGCVEGVSPPPPAGLTRDCPERKKTHGEKKGGGGCWRRASLVKLRVDGERVAMCGAELHLRSKIRLECRAEVQGLELFPFSVSACKWIRPGGERLAWYRLFTVKSRFFADHLQPRRFTSRKLKTLVNVVWKSSSLNLRHNRGRGGVVVRILAFHQKAKPGWISGGVTSGFSHGGIVLDDAAGWRVFLGVSRFPCPCIPALLNSRLVSPSSPRFTLFASQDLEIKSRPNLFTHSLTHFITTANFSVISRPPSHVWEMTIPFLAPFSKTVLIKNTATAIRNKRSSLDAFAQAACQPITYSCRGRKLMIEVHFDVIENENETITFQFSGGWKVRAPASVQALQRASIGVMQGKGMGCAMITACRQFAGRRVMNQQHATGSYVNTEREKEDYRLHEVEVCLPSRPNHRRPKSGGYLNNARSRAARPRVPLNWTQLPSRSCVRSLTRRLEREELSVPDVAVLCKVASPETGEGRAVSPRRPGTLLALLVRLKTFRVGAVRSLGISRVHTPFLKCQIGRAVAQQPELLPPITENRFTFPPLKRSLAADVTGLNTVSLGSTLVTGFCCVHRECTVVSKRQLTLQQFTTRHCVAIVPDDATGRQVFSGISRFQCCSILTPSVGVRYWNASKIRLQRPSIVLLITDPADISKMGYSVPRCARILVFVLDFLSLYRVPDFSHSEKHCVATEFPLFAYTVRYTCVFSVSLCATPHLNRTQLYLLFYANTNLKRLRPETGMITASCAVLSHNSHGRTCVTITNVACNVCNLHVLHVRVVAYWQALRAYSRLVLRFAFPDYVLRMINKTLVLSSPIYRMSLANQMELCHIHLCTPYVDDLQCCSRLVRRRSGAREVLDSNPTWEKLEYLKKTPRPAITSTMFSTCENLNGPTGNRTSFALVGGV
ncbi:hypothetical protein PR048_002310 [Dryococelus australis]|uniref:Uncharacterized protein n=1 Tax=Dryococelus australis TaxID=614101 RepID=A0ABQ9IL95_9NEOP|nr:hypothetical protein PR048_002310 [Dryococelus australis]